MAETTTGLGLSQGEVGSGELLSISAWTSKERRRFHEPRRRTNIDVKAWGFAFVPVLAETEPFALPRNRIWSLFPSEPKTRPPTHFTPLDDLTSSFLLNAKTQTYSHQYSSIYFLRLHELKKAVSQVARAKWTNAPGGPQHVPRVLEIKKGNLCYVIGTVYMDMRMKPSILDDIAKDEFNLAAPPSSKYFSDDDSVMLEDESGRVKLVGDVIKNAGLVTGIIVGALGMETPSGDFEVVDYCFGGLPPQSSLGTKSDKMDIDGDSGSSSSGEWIALVSGLEIGLTKGTAADADHLETSRQLLIEFLLGEAGGVEDQSFSSQISRLIILGNSVVPIVLEEEDDIRAVSWLHSVFMAFPAYFHSKRGRAMSSSFQKRFNASKTKYDPTPLYNLSSILTEISRALPTHIMPGSSDPTGMSLPQQPLPRPMFGKELASKGKEAFVCETNPTWIGIGDCE
ncbi:hypothetical protein FRB90_000586 [Tulasnella sp. 427]|nr:hypothetical protein FRB90_000586 [Tulasnella sp. 427]